MMVSSGLMVNFHFCGDAISELAIFFSADGCCPPDEEKMSHGCCSDETIYVAFDEDQLQQVFTYKKIYSVVDLPQRISFEYREDFSSYYEGLTINVANAPPILKCKIYLQLSRLKVFGDC
jgi:hypothetical protein